MLSKTEIKMVSDWVSQYPTKKGMRWKICVPDGFGNQVREQGFLSKDMALVSAAKYLRQKLTNRGLIITYDKTTFADYIATWIEQKKHTDEMRDQTLDRYALEFRRLKRFFGNMRLSEIRKHHLNDFIAEARSNDESENTIRYSTNLFKQVIRTAERDDLIPVTGIHTIGIRKPKKKEPKFLSQEEVEVALKGLREIPDGCIYALAILTGLRAGEIAGLKGDCVVFDAADDFNGTITVRRTYEQKTKNVVDTTKNGDFRKIPITPEMEPFLPKQVQANEFVFGGSSPFETTHLARKTRGILKKLGLPAMTFHELRHSACSYWEGIGMTRRYVQELMGHRNAETTERYSHVKYETIQNELRRLLLARKQNSNNILQFKPASA